MRQRGKTNHNILIFAGEGADNSVLAGIVRGNGYNPVVCWDVGEVCSRLNGQSDAAVLTDHVLTEKALTMLKNILSSQPEWSNFPLIVISSISEDPGCPWLRMTRDKHFAGHLQLLERPARTAELLSAIQSAVNGRMRQYQIRDELKRRSEVEKQLLEEAEKKNEFLALLGHELRNPLATLNAAVELIRRKPTEESRIWFEDVVNKQASQLQRLVNDLINISRISRGKIELRTSMLELNEQLHSALDASRPFVNAKNQKLSFNPLPENAFVEADPVRLHQILINLLKNASIYTPEGGSICLSAASSGETVRISCRDNGIGIQPPHLHSIFEPFMEVRPRDCRYNDGGLGIGLAFVKKLSELHGGTVHAESGGEGKGSEFIVSLPAIRPDAVLSGAGKTADENMSETALCEERTLDSQSSATSSGNSAARTVLIVEDNLDFAELLEETLADEGHTVTLFDNGPEAIEAAAATLPDVMIIDIGISGMDGYEIAEKIRKIPELKAVKLIALSGYNPDVEKAEKYFDHYIVKGTGIQKLFAIITAE